MTLAKTLQTPVFKTRLSQNTEDASPQNTTVGKVLQMPVTETEL